ncbi:MAG: PepSY domain-containing protein [Devosia sp.]
MKTLFRIILALAAAALLSAPALAAKGDNGNGNSNGNGQDKSESSDSGNNGNGNANGAGNGNGNNGNPNGNNGNGNNGNGNNGRGNPAGDPTRSNAIVVVPDDQQVVQNAVRAKAALSLTEITAVVGDETDGRILDVQLVTFKGIYLYDVTVLEQDGVLHKLYFNARSGVRVRTD